MAEESKQGGYTNVPNSVIRNKNLTTETKGVFIYMLSCPPNWVFNLKTLCRDLNERRTKIEHCLKQLVGNGFIKRKVVRENGKIKYYTYDIDKYGEFNNDIENLKPIDDDTLPF